MDIYRYLGIDVQGWIFTDILVMMFSDGYNYTNIFIMMFSDGYIY